MRERWGAAVNTKLHSLPCQLPQPAELLSLLLALFTEGLLLEQKVGRSVFPFTVLWLPASCSLSSPLFRAVPLR